MIFVIKIKLKGYHFCSLTAGNVLKYVLPPLLYRIFCVYLAISCEAPPDGENTEVVLLNTSSIFNASYEYKCIDGYKTDDPLKTFCTNVNTWSPPPPKCSRKL